MCKENKEIKRLMSILDCTEKEAINIMEEFRKVTNQDTVLVSEKGILYPQEYLEVLYGSNYGGDIYLYDAIHSEYTCINNSIKSQMKIVNFATNTKFNTLIANAMKSINIDSSNNQPYHHRVQKIIKNSTELENVSSVIRNDILYVNILIDDCKDYFDFKDKAISVMFKLMTEFCKGHGGKLPIDFIDTIITFSFGCDILSYVLKQVDDYAICHYNNNFSYNGDKIDLEDRRNYLF